MITYSIGHFQNHINVRSKACRRPRHHATDGLLLLLLLYLKKLNLIFSLFFFFLSFFNSTQACLKKFFFMFLKLWILYITKPSFYIWPKTLSILRSCHVVTSVCHGLNETAMFFQGPSQLKTSCEPITSQAQRMEPRVVLDIEKRTALFAVVFSCEYTYKQTIHSPKLVSPSSIRRVPDISQLETHLTQLIHDISLQRYNQDLRKK
jgi:hypothetical protein